MAVKYYRVSLQGRLPSGEVWSVNPVFVPLVGPADPSPSELLAAATAVANVAVPADLLTGLSTNGQLTGARIEARDESFGLVGVGEYSRTSPLAGTSTMSKTLQTSIVLSLRTPFPGASSRGRLYWPALAYAIDTSTGKMSGTVRDAIATAAASYLEALCVALTGAITEADTFGLAVYSRTKNTFHYVTEIWVGDIFDTQRRRRDALVESYAVRPFDPFS